MPKLILFAPCQKVIVSAQDNTASLISIIETFTIAIPEGADIPTDAVMPMNWSIFSMWELSEGEEGKSFEQRVDFLLPDGRNPLENATTTIDFQPHSNRVRNVFEVKGFPIPPQGHSLLNLSVREMGQESWQEVASFPIFILRPSLEINNTDVTNEDHAIEKPEIG